MPPIDDGSGDENAIIVVAERLRGQVDAPQPPILELDEQQIAAYGAGSISELVEALAGQVGSGSARGSGGPVFLVNGMRISSFREMRSYPPEAIQKIEVLPEEVALRFGYSADQRVVNFILKDQYSSREIELEHEQPWAGGNSSKEVELTYVRIAGQSRFNLNAEWNATTLLTEAERNLQLTTGAMPDLPTDPNPSQYRSLVSDSDDLQLTANWTTKLAESGASLSLNGTFERQTSNSLSGLNTVLLTDPDDNSLLRSFGADDPLEQRRRTTTMSFGSTVNAPLGDWQLTGTIDAGRVTTESEIDRYANTDALVAAAANGSLAIDGPLPALDDAGFDRAKTVSTSASSLVTLMGKPLWLPAGDVSLTVDSGYSWNRSESVDTRNPGLETVLTRGDLSAGVNLGIPIASRREDAWSWLGDFTLNLSAGVDHLSDFGTLTDWTAGFTWGLTEKLSLQGSFIARDAAPSLSQLGAPEIVTLNEPVYDISRGETVLASITSGGNPLLDKQKQRDIRLAAMWELPVLSGSNFMVEYFSNRAEDVSAGFPLLTPAIEAAFPGRVTRDNNGRLISIDQRPVTFAEQNSSRLKFGLNLSGPFGAARQTTTESSAPTQPFGAAPGAPGDRDRPQGERGQGGPNPERFAQIRESLCTEGETPDLTGLPEQMQAQLRGEDGQIDPEKLAQLKTRVCSTDGGGREGRRGDGEQGGQQPGGQQGSQSGDAVPMPGPGSFSGGARPGGGFGAGPRGPGAGGGRGPGGGGSDGRGRWFANLSYTLELENEVLIAEGLPVLDLLDGDALSGGGVTRHSADLRAGIFYRGFGTHVRANYSGPSRIDGSGLPGSTDLNFGSLATINLRFFADLGQQAKLVESTPFFKGSRVTFSVDNVFNSYRTVTDSNGDVPLRYQPGFLDPEGRTFKIEFRKLF